MLNRIVRQEFNANGSWTCPAGVTQVLVYGMGGGAGGGGGANATSSAGGSGGYGGMGCVLQPVILNVTPNTTYSITIGSGGAGGTNSAIGSPATSLGGAGTNTSFGALMIWRGAPTNTTTGIYQHYIANTVGIYTTDFNNTDNRFLQGTQSTAPNTSFAGTASASYIGLAATNGTMSLAATAGSFGAGGCSGEGIGGNGGNGGAPNAVSGNPGTVGTAPAANTGAGGAGGGGGTGGSFGSGVGAVGTAGASGQLVVMWAE